MLGGWRQVESALQVLRPQLQLGLVPVAPPGLKSHVGGPFAWTPAPRLSGPQVYEVAHAGRRARRAWLQARTSTLAPPCERQTKGLLMTAGRPLNPPFAPVECGEND